MGIVKRGMAKVHFLTSGDIDYLLKKGELDFGKGKLRFAGTVGKLKLTKR